MKKATAILIALLSLTACRKNRLKNDAEILVGEWEWVHTEVYWGSTGLITTFYETPANNDGTTYSVEFEKKGIATLYQDGEEIRRARIKILRFNDRDNAETKWWEFSLLLKGDGEPLELVGFFMEFESDTLYIRQWPIESGFTTVEANVFVRK